MSELSFGRFILDQANAPGVLGELAKAAWSDPHFPKDGSPEDVSRRLNEREAPGEFHDALDEAVSAWQALPY